MTAALYTWSRAISAFCAQLEASLAETEDHSRRLLEAVLQEALAGANPSMEAIA